MRNYRWIRVVALVLVLACFCGMVSAATYQTDLSGDGKTDVWDLQLAATQNKEDAHKNAIMTEILGNPDELHTNADGVYEIYTAFGLYNMANIVNKNKELNVTFRLMNDIDMEGAVWYTTDAFDGILEGNGHVISNFDILGERTLSASAVCQGFFAKVGRNGKVQDLKLENVNVVLTEESKANFIGIVTGSVVGELHDCTTLGAVIDPRTTLTSTVYIGTLCGRIENVTDNPVVGITIDDESILMTAESADVTKISGKSQKVLCKMGLDFGTLSYPEGTETSKQYKRQLGIAGWAPDYTNFKNYNWQEISGACTVEGGTGKIYNLQDPILTARRQAAVDKMREICTVQWTPAKDMIISYYKIGTGTNSGKLVYSRKIWKAGTTYTGMPYNHGSGSLERFYAYTEEGTNGVRKVSSSVPTYAFYYTHSDILNAMNTNVGNATLLDTNWNTYGRQNTLELINKDLVTASGNAITGYYDVVHQLSLAYQEKYAGATILTDTVKSADHAGWCAYLGNDCSQAIMWAWREVISSDVATGGTVISGVSQIAPTTTNQSRYGVRPVGGIVPKSFSVATIDAMYNKDTFMNAYAQASRGDAIIDDQTAGAHSRLIAYDPICIRNYRGVIDSANSYMITHEQGGSAKNEYTTCHWDRVLTFNDLLDDDTHKNDNADGKGAKCAHYFPVSINAFHNVDDKSVISNVTYSGGVVKSNFYILSTTVDGVETFNAIGQHSSTNTTTRIGQGYRDAHVQTDLTNRYGDLTGKTVTIRLSNGDKYDIDGTTGAVTKQ